MAAVLPVKTISRDKVRTCLFTGAWIQAPPPPTIPVSLSAFQALLAGSSFPFSLLDPGFHLKHGAEAPEEVERVKMSSEGHLGTRHPLCLLFSGADFSLGSGFFFLIGSYKLIA